jgi:DNA-binding NarL/FixJ family response regulator
MRVVLVGSVAERARLQAQLDREIVVVGEFPSLSSARLSTVVADAILIAPAVADDNEVEVVEPLTPREVQVLELLAEGLPNKAIAERLRISDQTVKFHVASISGKLGAANRTDAVRRAVRRGLIAL